MATVLSEIDYIQIGPEQPKGRLEGMRQAQLHYKNKKIVTYDCVIVEVERQTKKIDPVAVRLVLGTGRIIRDGL